MKQHVTLQEWTAFHKANKGAYTQLCQWIEEKRKQTIAAGGLGCTLTMEQNYWEWFTIGRMIEFLYDRKAMYAPSEYEALNIDRYVTKEGHSVFLTWGRHKELCDALWVVVREVLESERSNDATNGGATG